MYRIHSSIKLFLTGSLLLTTLFFSCNKDEDIKPDESGNWTQVTELKVEHGNLLGQTPFSIPEFLWYYSLEEGKVISYEEAQTDQWDFLYNPANDMIWVNNKDCQICWTRDGFGKEGVALMTMVPVNFTDVTEAADPGASDVYNKGLDWEGNAGERPNFAFNGYALGGTMGWWYSDGRTGPSFITKPVKDNTFIFRTNKGNYAKLQIQSIYKGQPENPTADSERLYLTFRYFVQKDGSRNLDTSN